MNSIFHRILLVAVTALLAGCQTVYEDKYNWQGGWRRGIVLDVGLADQLGDRRFRDCRPQAIDDERRKGKFIVVSFTHFGRPRHAVVPVSSDGLWRRGTPVYFKVLDCDAAVQAQSMGGKTSAE